MEVISVDTYDVVPGEKHLGKQIEVNLRIDRDEYIDGLIDCIIDAHDTFTLEEDDYEVEYNLYDNLDINDIERIYGKMKIELLDDDYGSDKEYQLVYSMLDDIVPHDFQDFVTLIYMRG